jgi:nitrile hydratase
MNGFHDLGGMDGFGAVEVEAGEPAFHQAWDARVFASSIPDDALSIRLRTETPRRRPSA